MSHVLPSVSIRWDVELGSLLLANMLSAWLDNQVVGKATEAAAHEPPQDHRASPQPVGLCVPPPVNSRPSASSSREHGTSVCVARESGGTRLRSALSPAIWESRERRWRDGKTSRLWWRMSPWGKWVRC